MKNLDLYENFNQFYGRSDQDQDPYRKPTSEVIEYAKKNIPGFDFEAKQSGECSVLHEGKLMRRFDLSREPNTNIFLFVEGLIKGYELTR